MTQSRKQAATQPCYGCVHLRYSGSASVTNRRDMMGGTAIPLREQDGALAPGRYSCAKLDRVVCDGNMRPRELEAGCKEAR